MTDTLHIARIQIENFKGIKCQDIEPGELTVLQGKNFSGKTSALQSIIAAFAKGGISDRLIHRDADVCSVRITMSDGMEIRRRKKRGSAPTVTVKTEDGATYSAAQSVLSELCDTVQFDPIAWLDSKDRVKTLVGALPLENPDGMISTACFDAGLTDLPAKDLYQGEMPLSKIARVLKTYMTERRDKGVEVRSLEQWIATEEAVEAVEDPTDAIAANAQAKANLTAGLESLETVADRKDAASRASDAADERLDNALAMVVSIDERLAETRARLAELEADESNTAQDLERCRRESKGASAAFDKLVDEYVAAEPEIAEGQGLLEQLDVESQALQATRGEYAERQRRLGALEAKRAQHDTLQDEHASLDTLVKALQQMPNELLTRADMPVEGLTYADGELLLGGVDVRELSGAETIRLGAQLAAHLAGQQKAQFILMDGLEAMDDEQREVLMDTIMAYDAQWIFTEVGDRAGDGEKVIIMGRDSE